ncbi:MAG: hypothetical protein JOZ54_01150, partial [Acidobacteria bacterium]|nr:hypothetical protein [Acidobacteriota bacterium]
MRTFDHYVLPLVVLFATAVGAAVADRAAGLRRRPNGDRGDFWSRVVWRVCVFLALPVALSGAASIAPG